MPSRIRICRISPVANAQENWGRSHKELLEEVVHDGLEVVDASLPEIKITSVTSSYDVTMIAEAHAKRTLQAEQEGLMQLY